MSRNVVRRWASIAAVAVAIGVGCQVKTVRQEPGIAEAGDPCKVEDTYACTPDGAMELVCSAGRFVVNQPCEGGCTILGGADATDTASSGAGLLLVCRDAAGNEK